MYTYYYIYTQIFMLAEFLPSSKMQNFCTITYCCVVHTWGGVGWGSNVQLHLHTHLYRKAFRIVDLECIVRAKQQRNRVPVKRLDQEAAWNSEMD